MKLLLTSEGWQKNAKIGKEFLKLIDKKSSEIRIFLVLTPTKYFKRNKYVRRLFGQFQGVNVPKKHISFFQLNRRIRKTDLKDIDVEIGFSNSSIQLEKRN